MQMTMRKIKERTTISSILILIVETVEFRYPAKLKSNADTYKYIEIIKYGYYETSPGFEV